MKLSEIAEHVVEHFPGSCVNTSGYIFQPGCREEWYEEHLIDSLIEFFLYEVLNICGCGFPNYTLDVIRRYLHIRNEYQEDRITYEQVAEMYESEFYLDLDKEHHYGLLQFMMYILDRCNLTEHGSSIGGAWLTDLGKMFLDVLNAWAEREECI